MKHEGHGYQCDQCNYFAGSTTHLKQHVNSVHEGIRYPCNECKYEATELAKLKRHMKNKHTEVNVIF